MALLRALRPLQWVKNVLLFAAPVFAGRWEDLPSLLHALWGFGVFCALASAGYLINDLRDLDADRMHPRKRHRPLASGDLSPAVARATVAILVVGGLVAAWLLTHRFFWLALSYLCLTLTYSAVLKRVAIVDVFAIATGFVLRAAAGGATVDVPLSEWFLLCVGFLALYIAISKRRAELALLGDSATEHRSNLGDVSAHVLDHMATLTGATAVMGYSMYSFSAAPSSWFMVTIPLVVMALFRYETLASQGEGGEPERLVADPALLAIAGSWVVAVLAIFKWGPVS